MKIKTITCHHVYNYGASLQAYALQHYLESQGHKVEIIDYRLPTHRRYELFAEPNRELRPLIKAIPGLKYLYLLYQRREMLKTWGRKSAFDKFDNEYLHVTDRTYRSIEEIRAMPPQADVYIAGSDQIWNTDSLNGRTEAYYLDFGEKSTKRISYAASFAVSSIKEELRDFVRQELAKFDKISVREKTGVKILKDMGLEGVQVVDPVFLLDKEQWIARLGLKRQPKNYIFLYDFLHNDIDLQIFVKELSRRENMKVISVNDFRSAPYADKQVNDAGPVEFLQLLLNARYVVSNSFHATAFSLIFHKPFYTYPLISQNNSSRMVDLLDSVGLMDRLKPDISTATKDCDIDWNEIDRKMNEGIEYSKRYLLL